MARETWNSKAEFILSTVGYSVGLGNVWRFPYVCYANGGGAFLIPYLVIMAIGVIPVMILETSLGQFTSLGTLSCWQMAPLFKGVGIAMLMVTTYCALYYPIIIAYIIRYMIASFSNPLPWVGCNHSWNTPNCYELGSPDGNKTTYSTNDSTAETVTRGTIVNETVSGLDNKTVVNTTQVRVRASEEYWEHGVLGITNGLHDMGGMNWQLMLCFLFTWLLVFVCIAKGIKSSGKVVYFTATFPYVVLFILLIRGVTLPGAMDGILLYIRPQWKYLLTSKVWKAAANQVFYSYGAGWGPILTLASYNKFKNNCYRDAIIFSCCCGASSILAGFVIFPIIGFMAQDSQTPIEDVVAAGPGLVFVAYPEALSRLPVSQLWSFLFFFMLLTVGLDSQFVQMEAVLTGFIDEFSMYRPRIRDHKTKITLAACLFFASIGLLFATQGGLYLMTLFDWYSAGFSPMLLSFMEIMVISYVYGANRFYRDIRSMIGYTPWPYAKYSWMFVAPVIVVLVIIFSFVDVTAATVGNYVFPPWAQAVGWTLTMSSIVPVIGYAILHLWRIEGSSFKQRLRISVTPTPEWGPALNEDRIAAGYQIIKQPGLHQDNEACHDNVSSNKIYIPLTSTDGDVEKDQLK
ncbi:sodium- and chloride-dependent glycine transporter 2-like [Amphiura filiformis]|uniref:sodium- and chloride-dependent glycine transporter 2-like n=1 Tax=Amphiura filiformis TaxID=82378 RepID=UPI003B211288